MGYAQYVQEQKNGDNKVKNDKVTDLNYENGPGMLPLLPAEVKGIRGKEVAKGAKEIIRSFFQRHYSGSLTGLLIHFSTFQFQLWPLVMRMQERRGPKSGRTHPNFLIQNATPPVSNLKTRVGWGRG